MERQRINASASARVALGTASFGMATDYKA
jgi:hypothetical protein